MTGLWTSARALLLSAVAIVGTPSSFRFGWRNGHGEIRNNFRYFILQLSIRGSTVETCRQKEHRRHIQPLSLPASVVIPSPAVSPSPSASRRLGRQLLPVTHVGATAPVPPPCRSRGRAPARRGARGRSSTGGTRRPWSRPG